jgi:hypothetical protein
MKKLKELTIFVFSLATTFSQLPVANAESVDILTLPKNSAVELASFLEKKGVSFVIENKDDMSSIMVIKKDHAQDQEVRDRVQANLGGGSSCAC